MSKRVLEDRGMYGRWERKKGKKGRREERMKVLVCITQESMVNKDDVVFFLSKHF